MTDAAAFFPDSAFPTEPFACPNCGQMLGPGCRTCVSCKSSIDPAEIYRESPVQEAVVQPPTPPTPSIQVTEPARFSWKIFFLVLAAAWLAAILALGAFGPEKGQAYLGLMQIATGLWVVFDARQKRIARPFRWGIGSIILWIVVFPWYLSRRRTPQAPSPFVEGIGLPILLLAYILVLVVLISVFKIPTKLGMVEPGANHGSKNIEHPPGN